MIKKTLYIFMIFSLFLVLGSALSLILLPFAADHVFLPKISQNLPFSVSNLSLSKISPWQVRGTIHLGDDEKSGIVIPKFEIHFAPQELLKKKISQIIIEAPVVHLERKSGKIAVRTMQSAGSAAAKSSTVEFPNLPVAIEKITIRDGLVVFHENEATRHNLNFEGFLHPNFSENAEEKIVLENITTNLVTYGILPSVTEIKTKRNSRGLEHVFNTKLETLEGVTANIPRLKNIELGGKTVIHGNVRTDGVNILNRFSAEISVANFLLKGRGVELGSQSEKKPLFIQLESELGKIDFTVAQMVLRQPEESQVSLVGEYDLVNGLLHSRVTGLPKLTSSPIQIDINGGRESTLFALNFEVQGEPFRIGENLTVGKHHGEGSIELSDNGIAGKFTGKIQQVDNPEKEITLKEIQLDLPFNYPALAPGVTIPGSLVINAIEYKNRNSAKLQATIEVSPDKAVVNSLLTTPLNENVQFTCSSSVNFEKKIKINCYLPKFGIDSATVGQFATLPEGLVFSGNVMAEARANIYRNSITGDATVTYSDGRLEFGEYTLSDIDVKVEIPKLPAVQSKPSQLATIGSLELGKIMMSDAAIRFRVDDLDTLFIEGIKLKWCGGRVETGGLKFYRDMEELDTTLYCDRLGYTELLNQLGIGDAEGEGSLNGRLPLNISKAGIRFDDGFLFSTPGDSGIVRFNNTEQLRQGMGSINQAAYLDYSLNALENFSYNWTKLTFNTENNQLLLALQLDGKPAAPLPYGYKQGRIVKSKTGTGLQHPIRLDVNFRLPLNDLFRYGKNIQSIMENM